MKKVLLLPLMAIMLASVSCNKEKNMIKETNNPDQNAKSVLMSEEIDDYTFVDMLKYSDSFQRYLFQHMKPETQARIWREKMDYLITNYYANNSNVKAVLESIKPYLTTELYSGDVPGNFSDLENQWVTSLVSEIGYDDTRNMMSTMSGGIPYEVPTPNGPDYPAPDGIKCECSTGSDWCFGHTYCKFKDKNCASSGSKGCGTFWGWSCDGRCAIGQQ